MLFTSISARPNVTPSDLFKEKGNTTDIPAIITETAIFGMNPHVSEEYRAFKSLIEYHTAANLLGKDVVVDSKNPFIDISGTKASDLLELPVVGLGFESMRSPDISHKMATLGFSKEKVQGSDFFRGRIGKDKLPLLEGMSALLDNYVPYGVCNLRGLIVFFTLDRILQGALMSFPNSSNFKGELYRDYSGITKIVAGQGTKYVASPTKKGNNAIKLDPAVEPPKVQGVICPYFEGLLLPDKNYIPRFVATHFGHLLGPTPDHVMATMTSIHSGWKTLSTTAVGMEITHIFFMIELAMSSGAKPLIIQKSDKSYLGTVLIGKKLSIVKNGRVLDISPVSEVKERIAALDTHLTALQAVVVLLNSVLTDEEGKVSAELLQTPRAIHNIVRRKTLTPEMAKNLKACFIKLSFRQDYWDPKDELRFSFLIEKFGKGEYLDNDAPIPYKTDVMFTSNIYQSTLSAFGSKAPTPSLLTGRSVLIPKETRKDKLLDRKSGGKYILPGVPIYVMPYIEASKGWANLKKTYSMYIKLNNTGNISEASKVFPRDSEQARNIVGLLSKYFGYDEKQAALTGKKRGRDDDTEEEEDAGKRARKTSRTSKAISSEFSVLFGSLGIKPAPHEATVVPVEDDTVAMQL